MLDFSLQLLPPDQGIILIHLQLSLLESMSTYYYYFKYTHTLHYTVEYLINKASDERSLLKLKVNIEIRIPLKRNTVKRIRNIYSELKCLRRVRLLLDRVGFIIERTKK